MRSSTKKPDISNPNEMASNLEAQKQYHQDVQRMSRKQEEEYRDLINKVKEQKDSQTKYETR